MSTVLDSLREKRQQTHADATVIAKRAADANRYLTQHEQSEFERLTGELDALDERIAQVADEDRRAAGQDATIRGIESRPVTQPGVGADRRLPPLMPDGPVLEELHRALGDNRSTRVETRAAVTSPASGASTLTTTIGSGRGEPRRIASAAGLSVDEVAGVERVAYPVFGAGDAGLTAEGVAKTEYAAVTPGLTNPQMITIWTDVTRQAILTMTDFEAKLRTVHAARVANREDKLLVDTVLATGGIQTELGAAVTADKVLTAAAKVSAGGAGADANLVILNPGNAAAVLGTSVGQGGSASPEFSEFLPRIHGMQVYLSNHVAAGAALVGAWSAGSRFVVGLRPTVLIDAVSQIKTNTITILLEEAVCLAVDEPLAFCRIAAT